jgi:hypothetical protein
MKEKEPNIVIFKPCSIWLMSKDENGEEIDAIQPRWWHKLMFWKKWNYSTDHWIIKRQYKSLKQMMDDTRSY